MKTSVSRLLASALRFQQRFAPPRNATFGCTKRGEETGETRHAGQSLTDTAGRRLLRFYVGCAPSCTRNPIPEHSFGDPALLSPGFPLLFPAGPQGAPDGPSPPASASAPPRPDVGEAAATCASRPVTCSAPPAVLSASGESPGPDPTGRQAPGSPRGAARPPRRGSSPATRPLPTGRFRDPRPGTRPFCLSSRSPSS